MSHCLNGGGGGGGGGTPPPPQKKKKKKTNNNNLSALKKRPIDLTWCNWFAKIIACIAGGLFDIGRERSSLFSQSRVRRAKK